MERALSAIPTKRVLLNSSFCSVLFKDKAASNTLQRGSELQLQPCSPSMLSVSERGMPSAASSRPMLRSQAVLARERSWMFENACCTFLQATAPQSVVLARPRHKPPVHVYGPVASKGDVPRELGPR